MKRWKKTICMSVAVLVSCMVIGATAFAATKTKIYPYKNVGTSYMPLNICTPDTDGQVMTWSTRPTSGQGGAEMWVANSENSGITHRFPYQETVPPLKISLKKGVSYTSHIRAHSGTVSGNATWTITW